MAPWGLLLACIPKKWKTFDKFAAFGIPALEENRHKVLRFTVALNLIGFCMAMLGLIGGFSDGGFFLKTFYWARMSGEKGRVIYAGVKHTCDAIDNETRLGLCKDIVDVPCDNLALRIECSLCQQQAAIMVGPMVIACITFLTLERNTMLRYSGRDSRQAKVMGAFAAFFGGANFLSVLLGYWKTCIAFAREYDNIEASMGLGLLLMGVGATTFKFITGFVHVGLSVEEEEQKLLTTESESDAELDERGGDSSDGPE